MADLKEKLRTTNLLSQRNQRALQNEAADRIEKLEAALREVEDMASKRLPHAAIARFAHTTLSP